MKYVKMLGLLAIAATALMAFAGSASATELTSPAGTKVGVGTEIVATTSHSRLTGTIPITCTHSEVKGKVTNAGGASATVEGSVDTLTFTGCTQTVTVSKRGTLTLHRTAAGTGTVTSSGAEVTVVTHGILGTQHCIYVTNGTTIGTFIASGHTNTTGGTSTTATLDIESEPIDRLVDGTENAFCGSDAEWDGTYTVSSPDPLYID